MELSKEMAYQILSELSMDANKMQQDVQRMTANSSYSQIATIEYKDVESLRYIIKQMEVKVKILGGSWSS